MATFLHSISALTVASAIALPLSALASPAPDLRAQFEAVCTSPAIKSDKLTEACAVRAMPAILKDGTRFKAVGIGAELNALASNLHLINR